MKGVVFTEFLDFVEARSGAAMVDAIIDDCDLSTNGAYTSVGAYPYSEFRDLVLALSRRTGSAPGELLREFGRRFTKSLAGAFAPVFREAGSLFGLLASIDGQLRVEVRKLYPDASLPTLTVTERADDRLVLDYRSARGLEALIEGVIDACAEHYGEPVDVALERSHDDQGSFVRFTVQKQLAAVR